MVVMVVIMVIVVIKKNYFGRAWSFELLGTPNLIGLPEYGGYGGYGDYGVYLDFQEKIRCGARLLESLVTPDLLEPPGYGGYRGYHSYYVYLKKLIVVWFVGANLKKSNAFKNISFESFSFTATPNDASIGIKSRMKSGVEMPSAV